MGARREGLTTSWCVVLLLTAGLQALGVAGEEALVRARLVADVTSIEPGATFRLGVLLRMKPGWHVYWRNPGDSGLATEVAFALPRGFAADALRWPVPVVFTQPGELVGYGYEGEVLHWVQVTVPKDLGQGASVTLQARVSWLACKDLCVPGDASPSLELPVARDAEPANRALFDAWGARLPEPLDPKRLRVSMDGAIPPGAKTGQFTVTATWAEAAKAVAWIPAATADLAVSDVRVQTAGRQTRIRCRVEWLGTEPLPGILESLIVFAEQDGPQRRGVRVPVRLRAAAR